MRQQTVHPPLRGLITGCGRSGTAYLAEVLTAGGDPCGHEAAYDVRGVHATPAAYESSWYAVAHLREIAPGTPVLHLVRDPLRVMASFYRIGLASALPLRQVSYGRGAWRAFRLHRRSVRRRWEGVLRHRRFLARHGALGDGRDEIGRLAAYWTEWNRMCEAACLDRGLPYRRVRLEEVDSRLDEIAAFLRLRGTPRRLPPANLKQNYGPRPMPATPLPEDTRRLAAAYGYDTAGVEQPGG